MNYARLFIILAKTVKAKFNSTCIKFISNEDNMINSVLYYLKI